MSIQLSLDGHSFSAQALAGDFPGDGAVEVELLTARTMLVPREAFSADSAEELFAAGGLSPAEGKSAVHSDPQQEIVAGLRAKLLAAAGLAPAEGECVVYSDPQQEVVALMAANAEAVETVAAKLGGRARYTTPLLEPMAADAPTVWMRHTGELLYIKVWEERLRFAGVVPASSDADLLYVCERLGQEFLLENYGLRLAPPAEKRLRKLLKPYFREVVCE